MYSTWGAPLQVERKSVGSNFFIINFKSEFSLFYVSNPSAITFFEQTLSYCIIPIYISCDHYICISQFADFDDMSCEIIFGQDPPAQEDDPAFKRPCYKLCIYSSYLRTRSHK